MGPLLWFPACGPSQAEVAEETYQEGIQALNQGQYAEALARFDSVIVQDSLYAEAYLGRGLIRTQANQPSLALKDLDKALEIDPHLSLASFYRGMSLVILKRYEEALPDLERAIASGNLPNQDLLRAHRWHGIALLNLERYEEALPDFTRCVELEPENPFHRLERGRIYEYVGQPQRAREDYTTVLALSNGESELVKEARQRLENLETPQEALQK